MKHIRRVLITSAITVVAVTLAAGLWAYWPQKTEVVKPAVVKKPEDHVATVKVKADDTQAQQAKLLAEQQSQQEAAKAKILKDLQDAVAQANTRADKAEQSAQVAMKLSQLLETQKAKAVDDLNDQVVKLEAEKRKLQADAVTPGTTQAVELQAQVLELTGKLATSEANLKAEAKARAAAETRIARAEFLAKSAQQQLERQQDNNRGTKPKMGTDKGAW